ncbi:MAG: hypothetical protein U0176_25260, partial [Bacteroidia bacterium]
MNSILKVEDKSPLTWVARVISLVCHPIWLPMVYAAWRTHGDPEQTKLLVVLAIFGVIFPGLVTLLWIWFKSEIDVFVISRPNRIVPLIAGLIGMAFFAVANGGLLPERLFQGELMAITILLLFIGIIVTLFWKISLHLLSWGAVNVFIFQTGNWGLFAAILVV